MRRIILLMGLTVALLFGALPGALRGAAPPVQVLLPQAVPGLQAQASLIRDDLGIPHIFARNAHDLYLMTGYVQAQDRLFQMDTTRRLASGTLAELLGPDALSSDVQLRTLGLRRAAELSLQALSPQTQADLKAFAQGVNAYLAQAAGQLPPEYGALELTQVAPWTPLDSVVIAKAIAFQLSFDLDVNNTIAWLGYVQALGPENGTALFSEDLFRSAPADPATIVPDAEGHPAAFNLAPTVPGTDETVVRLAQEYVEKVKNIPFFQAPLNRIDTSVSSNWIVIGGQHTQSGAPLLASDPHLALSSPAVWYEIDQKVDDGATLDVSGTTFPGSPYVILGFNDRITWGATVNPLDVTDTFSEKIVAGEGGQLFSAFRGELEPVQVIPETYRANLVGDGAADDVVTVPPERGVPPATLVIPRHGPVINFDPQAGEALSVQYTGFYATRELDAFRTWNGAANLEDFKAGLQFFDFGSQDWSYADVDGNIAYFASAELPLREDLEAGFVDGNVPPWFIRDGTGTLQHQWIPQAERPADQAVPFEVLPFEELPQTVNPAQGWIISSNNDPVGTTLDNNPLNQLRPTGGLYYLNPGYAVGLRAGRLTRLVRAATADGGKLELADVERLQGNVQPLHAELLTPYLLDALGAIGQDPALAPFEADPRLAQVKELLADWDYSHPTGIPDGFDFDDTAETLNEPSQSEIRHSAAATVFNVWLSRLISNTIDGTLEAISPRLSKPDNARAVTALLHLLKNFEQGGGVGASGVPFFNVPGAPADLPTAAKRDIVLLKSLQDALDALAGEAFASAFGGSTDLLDYRWGKLHRLVLTHLLGGPFNVPPQGSFAADGGWSVVDRSDSNVRGADADGFTFTGRSGPSRRFIAEAAPTGVRALNAIPGGPSGVPGAPHYADQVTMWLANEYHPLFFERGEIQGHAETWQDFFPGS